MPFTTVGLSGSVRAEMVSLLNGALAGAIDLQLRAKHAHWNVRGPDFIALHGLFDKVAEVSEGFADELAERVAALGGVAAGLAPDVARAQMLPGYPAGEGQRVHVEGVARSLAGFGVLVRRAIDMASTAGDQGTADLFTGHSREADKLLWFVESHLAGE